MVKTSSKLRVAICGGGISGLCLALALARYSHVQVDLYEATDRFKEIGAGVMIWSRTWEILNLMGLADAFSRIAHAPPNGSIGIGFDYRRSDQPKEGFRFQLVEMPYGCIRFHRAAFLDVFVDHLPPGVAHFGKRVVSYSESATVGGGPIIVHFADNTTATCDVLVGCDGIKSTVRAQLFRTKAQKEQLPELLRYIDPVWSGTIAYRGLIPVGNIPNHADGSLHTTIHSPMMYCGKGKHVVSYSISQGDIVNVVTFASQPEKNGTPYIGEWVTDCSKQELLECYSNWEPEVEELLKCIENPTRWAIHHLRPLPLYVSNRVVLVGDAAHAMTPHQGAGAGQAIEDAFILAELLAKAKLENVYAALDAYEKVRLPVANGVLRGSYESGMMYEFNSSLGEKYESLGPAIQRQWDWISSTSVEDDVVRALHLFKTASSGAVKL
ncbi:FAD/NAD-P-binding domain-containing protein [Crucibulum laeve]|uniref:FAD/NAD-P-binding domain-containing protein n=1 Tax=Crucibulum laeve TaxID=68775 RepID=A0A5C3MHM5_9AGAR|nr:FAD/NAD-P-binding domain-containing protein [Crucibulum laeve]